MGDVDESNSMASIQIENIGGIEQVSESLDEGVTVLAGRNASNRTSFLQALMAVAGSERASLKADASEGHVELGLKGETYSRRLTRSNGRVRYEGSSYLDDTESVELFAFLLEANDCRRAVRGGEDLQEILMRPIDTDALEREIRELETERRQVDERLSRLERLERELPQLEERKQTIGQEIEELEEQVEEARAEVDAIDDDESDDELEEKLDRLNDLRRERRRVENQLSAEAESIEALESELENATEAFENRDEVSSARQTEIEGEIDQKRTRIDRLEETINKLASLIRFNEEMLSGDRNEWLEQISSSESDGDLTDKLLDEGQTTCWTCGTEVDVESIEENLDSLRSIRGDIADERNAVSNELQERQRELRELEGREREVTKLERTIEQTERELDERRETREDLEARADELEDEIADLEAEVEESRKDQRDELLDRHADVATIESDLDDRRHALAEVEDRMESVEADIEDREQHEQHRERISERLEELRTRVEDLQEEAVESFNDHMETVLDLLDYENLERIWIERKAPEGARRPADSRFELHIVRSVDGETIYEDTIDHLSESEREVTGLVFALAGYLVHEVYEDYPFMLLDSIEMLDSQRIARLVEYFEDYADYLVVALLEEDAAALDGTHSRIESI